MKPLGPTQRKLLLLVALHRRQHGVAPTWTELQRAVGVPRYELVTRLHTLRERGLVTFVDDEPGTTDVTPRGGAAAVGREGAA